MSRFLLLLVFLIWMAWRAEGEAHLFTPEAIHRLQKATRTGNYAAFKEYAKLVNEQGRNLCTLRSLLDFKQSPGLTGRLQHRQYDSFRTIWDNPAYEKADVTFALDAQGKVAQITMKAALPLADFSWDYQDLLFKPVAAK